MRDIETIIRELNLPAHFKKHPPRCRFAGTKFEQWWSLDLYGLIMNGISREELDALQGAVMGTGYIGFGAFDPGSHEENAFIEVVKAIWREVSALEDRTLDEHRMKPARVFALENSTKTVHEFWKVLHDLEQGGRNEQRGLSAKINKLTKERDELKAKCAKLEDALRAAQVALAEKISTH